MGGRTTLAEYFVTQDETLLFIGRTDFQESAVFEIQRSQAELREFVRLHFGQERDATGRVRTVGDKMLDWQNHSETLQSFFAPFVAPLAEKSPVGDPMTNPDDTIWFVPHDALHYMPLQTIHLDGQYLGARNPICSRRARQLCATVTKIMTAEPGPGVGHLVNAP